MLHHSTIYGINDLASNSRIVVAAILHKYFLSIEDHTISCSSSAPAGGLPSGFSFSSPLEIAASVPLVLERLTEPGKPWPLVNECSNPASAAGSSESSAPGVDTFSFLPFGVVFELGLAAFRFSQDYNVLFDAAELKTVHRCL